MAHSIFSGYIGCFNLFYWDNFYKFENMFKNGEITIRKERDGIMGLRRNIQVNAGYEVL